MPKALNIGAKAPSADKIDVALVEFGSVGRNEGDVTIEVHAAGINPSDAKAMLGIMPSAVFPRTPGRDFAGVVVEGPNELKGLEVWGSGGDIGISRNGSHADRLVLPAAAIRRKPGKLSMLEAGTIGVPFVTAYEGCAAVTRRRAMWSRSSARAESRASGRAAASRAARWCCRRSATDARGYAKACDVRRLEQRKPSAVMVPTSSTTLSAARTSPRPMRSSPRAGGRSS
jgi:hypothetical protein